jgi:type VI secretion system ImpA family protein
MAKPRGSGALMLDLEEMLAPVSEEEPAGPDLAYDNERGLIEQAFESSVSIDTNGEVVESSEIDWRNIIRLIDGQTGRTKDVWLAVYLCRAGARSGQLDVIVTGAQYLAGLFEQFWDNVHPQLEEYGYQGRKGPCESLTRRSEFLAPLDRTVLLAHPRLGGFTGSDFERFRASAEAADGYGLFRAALQDTAEEDLTAIVGKLDAIEEAFRASDRILTANADGDTGANFQPTYDLLGQMKRAVLSFTSAPAPAADSGDDGYAEAGGEVSPGGGGGGPRIGGRVETREDVIKALDAIADYYRRREPGSPVAVALQRAREWVNLDFMALLEDIAPGALDEAKRVLVSQRKPPAESGW